VDAFTEVVDPGSHDEHDCHDREYRQQIAVPLDGRMDVNTHGLSPLAGVLTKPSPTGGLFRILKQTKVSEKDRAI
jgi:hypothetical protein